MTPRSNIVSKFETALGKLDRFRTNVQIIYLIETQLLTNESRLTSKFLNDINDINTRIKIVKVKVRFPYKTI